MNLLSCCLPCFRSPIKVAPANDKIASKYLSITSSGLIKHIPEALYQSIFTFEGCSDTLGSVCHLWNRIYRISLNSFSFQFFQYKNLCQKIPLFKAVFNITERPALLASLRDRIISCAVTNSIVDIKSTRIDIAERRTIEHEFPDRSFEMICKDRLEKIEACFDLILKVLPTPEDTETDQRRHHNFIPRCMAKLNLLKNLNILSFFYGIKKPSPEDHSTDIRLDLRFLIASGELKPTADKITQSFSGKNMQIIASTYNEGRIRSLVTAFPSILKFYVNIEELDMSNQKILFLPEFTTLTQLRVLNLAHNLLTEIPSHVVHSLANLRILNLEHNLIGTIPIELRGLKKLTLLNLCHNPFIEATMPTSLSLLFGEHITCLL